jgi:hypothetical protein
MLGDLLRQIFFLERERENLAGPFWSLVFLVSSFVTVALGFYRFVPWQFILSGLFGLYGTYRIIRYGIVEFWYLGHISYRGCAARLIGSVLSTFYLGLVVLGLLMLCKGIPSNLPQFD